MLCFFCSIPVIGGNNVYVRVSVSGECKNKDSVLETLKNKVMLYCNNHDVLFLKKRIVESNWPVILMGQPLQCNKGKDSFPPLS